MRNILKNLPILGGFFFLTSCSLLNTSMIEKSELNVVLDRDYSDQLNHLGDIYLNKPKTNKLKLSSSIEEYFSQLIDKIVKYNKTILGNKKIEHRVIIEVSDKIFFASFPDGRIIISSQLVNKYLDNEDILVSVLSYLIFTLNKQVYLKRIAIPIGVISINEILAYNYLPLKVKAVVNQWAYLMMKKAGFDSNAYLNWIQIQNKNVVDFRLVHRDLNQVSREEYVFKNYVAKAQSSFDNIIEGNSSKNFYQFKRYVALKTKRFSL